MDEGKGNDEFVEKRSLDGCLDSSFRPFCRTVGDPSTGLIHMFPIGGAMYEYHKISSYDEAAKCFVLHRVT